MAKGSLFLGQAKGKVGTVVNYVAKGEQRSRIYTKEGGRPGERATLPAREQRIRFGAASSEWALYKFICSNMYKSGKLVKESDYNFFVRKNWKYFPFLTKQENQAKEAYWIPGTFATGRLGTCNLCSVNNANGNDIVIQTMDIATAGAGEVKSTDTMDKYVEFLLSAYPNASKVTFAILLNGINGEVMGTANTPNSRIHTYTLDLYDTPLEQLQGKTVGTWMEEICSNEVWIELAAYAKAHEITVAKGSLIMAISNTDAFTPPTPPAPPTPVTLTFIYHDGRREELTGMPGETFTWPTNTSGYIWDAMGMMGNRFPATSMTINETDGEDEDLYNSQEREVLENDSNNIIIALFPTNERANDVYTVNILPYDTTNSAGGYWDYALKRSVEAMEMAAESYGYQADTMHANIYYSGDSIDQDIDNSIKIMALHDATAAEAMASCKAQVKQERAAKMQAYREYMANKQQKLEQELSQADALIESAIETAKSKGRKKK